MITPNGVTTPDRCGTHAAPEETREPRDGRERKCRTAQNGRIGGIYSKQQRRKQAGSDQSSGKAHADADKRQQGALGDDHPNHLAGRSPQSQPDSDLTFPLSD